MPRNPIQFQSGLSLPAFLEQYGMEAQCQEALFQHRWPKGLMCRQYHLLSAIAGALVAACYYMGPAMIVLLSVIFLHESTRLGQVVAIGMAFCGVPRMV